MNIKLRNTQNRLIYNFLTEGHYKTNVKEKLLNVANLRVNKPLIYSPVTFNKYKD